MYVCGFWYITIIMTIFLWLQAPLPVSGARVPEQMRKCVPGGCTVAAVVAAAMPAHARASGTSLQTYLRCMFEINRLSSRLDKPCVCAARTHLSLWQHACRPKAGGGWNAHARVWMQV